MVDAEAALDIREEEEGDGCGWDGLLEWGGEASTAVESSMVEAAARELAEWLHYMQVVDHRAATTDAAVTALCCELCGSDEVWRRS